MLYQKHHLSIQITLRLLNNKEKEPLNTNQKIRNSKRARRLARQITIIFQDNRVPGFQKIGGGGRVQL